MPRAVSVSGARIASRLAVTRCRPGATEIERRAALLVTEARVGAVREKPADARRAPVRRRSAKRLPAEGRIRVVDGCPGGDEGVDDVESLVIRRHHERANARVRRGIIEPTSDVAGGCSLLDAVDLRPGCDEHVDDVRHAEHGGMEESRAAGHAARVVRRPCLEVGARLDQDARDGGVAVARRGDQRRLRLAGVAVDGRAGGEQRAGQLAGARHVAPLASRRVVAQHRDIAERRRASRVVARALHPGRRETGLLGEQLREADGVSRVEDLAHLHQP